MTKLYKSFWVYAAAIPALVIAADQASKYWATAYFNEPFNICAISPNIGYEKGLFKDMTPILDLALTCNQGVSFGLLGGDSDLKRWALTLFAMIMCGVLYYILTDTKDRLSRLGIALIIGGAIGNGIDRFFFGAVTDFINVEQLIPFFPWVFNIADSAITCGVIGLLLAGLLQKPATKSVDN